MKAGFPDNWVGEPTNVMMRRSLFERVGGFHPRIRQAADMALWLHAMFHCDVGFVDESLATYHAAGMGSVTDDNFRYGKLWLDRLWLLESLLSDDSIRAGAPGLRRMIRRERLSCGFKLARTIARGADAAGRARDLRDAIASRRVGAGLNSTAR
jgi:hypothetical protein